MLKYALLASGSKGNSCLVKNGNTSIMIDCGGPKRYMVDCLKRLQYDLESTDALFITHNHSDHIGQLKMFDDIPTYAMCDIDTPNLNKLAAFDDITLGSLNIKVLPTSHDSGDSCGFVVTQDNERLVYITDTGYISEDIMPYMENADYYIFESNHDIEMLMQTNRPMFVKQRIINDTGHLCNEACAEALSALVGGKTKEIVLAHISEQGNSIPLALQTLKQVFDEKGVDYKNMKIIGAPQYEIIRGGSDK